MPQTPENTHQAYMRQIEARNDGYARQGITHYQEIVNSGNANLWAGNVTFGNQFKTNKEFRESMQRRFPEAAAKYEAMNGKTLKTDMGPKREPSREGVPTGFKPKDPGLPYGHDYAREQHAWEQRHHSFNRQYTAEDIASEVVKKHSSSNKIESINLPAHTRHVKITHGHDGDYRLEIASEHRMPSMAGDSLARHVEFPTFTAVLKPEELPTVKGDDGVERLRLPINALGGGQIVLQERVGGGSPTEFALNGRVQWNIPDARAQDGHRFMLQETSKTPANIAAVAKANEVAKPPQPQAPARPSLRMKRLDLQHASYDAQTETLKKRAKDIKEGRVAPGAIVPVPGAPQSNASPAAPAEENATKAAQSPASPGGGIFTMLFNMLQGLLTSAVSLFTGAPAVPASSTAASASAGRPASATPSLAVEGNGKTGKDGALDTVKLRTRNGTQVILRGNVISDTKLSVAHMAFGDAPHAADYLPVPDSKITVTVKKTADGSGYDIDTRALSENADLQKAIQDMMPAGMAKLAQRAGGVQLAHSKDRLPNQAERDQTKSR